MRVVNQNIFSAANEHYNSFVAISFFPALSTGTMVEDFVATKTNTNNIYITWKELQAKFLFVYVERYGEKLHL